MRANNIGLCLFFLCRLVYSLRCLSSSLACVHSLLLYDVSICVYVDK